MAAPKIVIRIGADNTFLRKDLKKTDGIVKNFTRTAGNAMGNLAMAAGGAAIAIGINGTKAAIEDQKAQVLLAKQLEISTGATDAQVKSVEKYIDELMYATNVTDEELRPSLATLVRATKDVTEAQRLQRLAVDISVGSGKDLQTVSLALAKAYGGQLGAITRLGIPLDENIVKAKDSEAAFKVLSDTFSGTAAEAADTVEGKLENVQIRLTEAQEAIGEGMLPALEDLAEWMTSDEGQQLIVQLTETFGTVFQAAAEALPEIINGLKKVGTVASGLGLDIDTFMNPQLLAAAAAFRMTPGPVQIKALAAIAAYAAFDQGLPTNAANQASFAAASRAAMTGKARPQLDYGSYFTGTWSGANAAANQAYNQYGTTSQQATTNIYISGAQDSAAAARGVRAALNQTNAQGVSDQKGKRTN